ncbi:alpha/beta hydrolase [Kineosporia mesophila]|uniref:Alpha/beta hydrolase n=1 Tax=Kineosporia mesophila TaxID=566012 RepID=A0ABP7AED8_9ACTN|nr:alpha/beta hydrolase [Kineosporia mesophila]MCD5352867.1 alpha/beta fold hydrolase [Kineosporia mesophila]
MPVSRSGRAEIYYETMGAPDSPPLVLISGHGAQLVSFPEGFCDQLAAAGLWVIRLDNRDTGLSQMFGGPEDLDGGYDLDDMASDVLAVLDDLGLDSAHVLGQSMGGFIAQLLALDHPERVRSLTLLYTIPGKDPAHLIGSHDGAAFAQPQKRWPREDTIEGYTGLLRFLDGDGYPFDEDEARAVAARAYDRGYRPDGVPRQWAAILRAPSRTERLHTITVPTLILHGRNDPSLHWRAAVDMAALIDGAEVHVYAGMGHSIPRELWPELTATIHRHTGRA